MTPLSRQECPCDRPDDRRDVLFTIVPMSQGAENAQVAVLDLETGERKTLIRGGSHAEYVETGHLVYATGGTLRAVRFDLARLEVTSDAFPVGGIGGSSADHIHR